ncbi:hypothetical protein [Kitasatospora sp. NPDC007106]|uniref:hypothetical protein n=1 Tax=Kitasatospora sp. NPDC007106 TaxID=3156914 RepID=UPI0033EB4024
MKTWTDRLPQIPYPDRGLPAEGPWMTLEEAASRLGIGAYHLNVLTSVTHRIGLVRTTGTELAVIRAGVEAELAWRATASTGQKLRRLLKDTLAAL